MTNPKTTEQRESPTLDFGGDPDRVSLFIEYLRLAHGYQFNSTFATEISRLDPLPHQHIAVYKRMLDQEPLRFLLADDAGAGKTIMTGLYVREMLQRNRIHRALIIPPAGLVGNWERELRLLFHLHFRIVSGANIRSGNPFEAPEGDLAIISLDTIRGKRAFSALADPQTAPYDLVVFDEAHKLSVADHGGRIKRTQRYKLAEALAGCPTVPKYSALSWAARHLLLLTATPHMGKDTPYYYLWRLLDHNAFGSAAAVQKLPHDARRHHFIRRTKEEMVDFEKRPIFRERRSDTFGYDLTEGERELYELTTHYLKHSYNMVTGNQQAVRLAMGVFQRRLVSSTYALAKSFVRRIEKVKDLIADLESIEANKASLESTQRQLNARHQSDFFETYDSSEDLRDDNARERNEDYEDEVLGAVAHLSVGDLQEELMALKDLLRRANDLIRSGEESKFERLRGVLEDPRHNAEKWLVFSEHRDTVDHLVQRLEALGYTDRVATIHGGMAWPEREEQVDRFRDPEGARFLIATDAAGEGINLQFCRLMANYDIPWNPARLEQRMGRIHRYGQKHDVRIINLVSRDTREGRVLAVLLERLEAIRKELSSDKVFDVIGRLFENQSLRAYLAGTWTDEAERQACEGLKSTLSSAKVRETGQVDEKRVGPSEGVKGSLGKLLAERERAKYQCLLPIYTGRFIENAARELGLRIQGDIHGSFTLAPKDPGAMDALLPYLEIYPSAARKNLNVRRPADDKSAIWLHPGEPVFDAICEMVQHTCARAALRGSIFIDPHTTVPYLWSLAEVIVEEVGNEEAPRRTLEQLLVMLSQREDKPIAETSLNHFFMRLVGAGHIPPGAVPMGARTIDLRDAAREHLDIKVRGMAKNRKEQMRSELPKRKERIGINFNLKGSELASRRIKLRRDPKADPAELEAVKNEQRVLEETRKLVQAKLDLIPNCIEPGEVRFLAHALVIPPTGQKEREEVKLNAQAEKIAMRMAMEFERTRKAQVHDVSRPKGARQAGLQEDYPGFDLLSIGIDGKKRHIEVKGRSGSNSIQMEANEWQAACNLKEEYWLYAAFNCSSDEPVLVRVCDPFGRLLSRSTTRLHLSAKEVMGAAEADPL